MLAKQRLIKRKTGKKGYYGHLVGRRVEDGGGQLQGTEMNVWKGAST